MLLNSVIDRQGQDFKLHRAKSEITKARQYSSPFSSAPRKSAANAPNHRLIVIVHVNEDAGPTDRERKKKSALLIEHETDLAVTVVNK